ncbi:MAG: hypothetical protein MUQ20_01155, partial [Deltaproteobacteria bacterium]|nr:hypothetical protein [Deltaproteobacteria bacterium]
MTMKATVVSICFYFCLRKHPMALSLQSLTVRKMRTWKEGGREMTMRTAGPVQRIGFAALAFTLAFLACGAAMASDVERQIPVTRDTAG